MEIKNLFFVTFTINFASVLSHREELIQCIALTINYVFFRNSREENGLLSMA
jgi:hypothetical protein